MKCLPVFEVIAASDGAKYGETKGFRQMPARRHTTIGSSKKNSKNLLDPTFNPQPTDSLWMKMQKFAHFTAVSHKVYPVFEAILKAEIKNKS